MNKRYYINEDITIDLEDVVGIAVRGYTGSGYSYEVAFKSGTKLKCYGVSLRTQFAEYKGITEEETKE